MEINTNKELNKIRRSDLELSEVQNFKELLIGQIFKARKSANLEFINSRRDIIKKAIYDGMITRDFLASLYEELGINEDVENKTLTVSGIIDELIPLPKPEAMPAKTGEQNQDESEIETPEISEDEQPPIFHIQETILPADHDPIIKPGEMPIEMPKSIPRAEILTRMLLDLGYNKKDIMIIAGQNKPEMFRRESYQLFLVKPLEKMILVCNEEGNQTFIIHRIAEDSETLKKIYSLRKSELNKTFLNLMEEIRWPRNAANREKVSQWQEKILSALIKESDFSGQLPDWPKLLSDTEKESIRFEKAPEGWQSYVSIAAAIGKGTGTIKLEAEKYRKVHPDWFKKYSNRRGRVVEHYSAELAAVITAELSKSTEPPEGWMTGKPLAKLLGRNLRIITAFADHYRSKHPDWFVIYLDKAKKRTEHYSPELILAIKKDLAEIKLPPPGWMNNYELSKKLKRANITTTAVAEKYRVSHPEWFGIYSDSRGAIKKIEHFSPELIEEITKEVFEVKDAPKGWMTCNYLANILDKDIASVRKAADIHRDSHPEWFMLYRDKIGKKVEHYSPELAEILLNQFSQMDQAPKGWQARGAVAELLNRNYRVVESAASRYRLSHPEWLKTYLDKSGKSNEHYSPELIAAIAKDLAAVEKAPVNWMTLGGIRKLKRQPSVIKDIADSFRESHPEWFSVYLDKTGKKSEHYSPELVEIIDKNVSDKE